MGHYKRLPDDWNGRPAYIKNTTEPLFIYFFSSEKEFLNLWVIGPILGQIIAGIRNSGQGECVDSLEDGWIYASHDAIWRDNDQTLTVKCAEAHEIIIQDLENLELNKTKITIGLKTFPSKSGSKVIPDNPKMKHKEMNITEKSKDLSVDLLTKLSMMQKSMQNETAKKVSNNGTKSAAANTVKTLKPSKKSEKVKPKYNEDIRTNVGKISKSEQPKNNQIPTTVSKTASSLTSSGEKIEEITSQYLMNNLPKSTKTPEIIPSTPQANNLTLANKPPLTRCYSCGSLFSSDATDCPTFDATSADQQVTCKYGDACLFYAWKISEKETGGQIMQNFQSLKML